MQYIYGYHELNTAPDNPTSAKVAPRRVLSGPTMETGKSSTVGAVLTGEHIAVALAIQAAGSGAKAHTHPNEQFNVVLAGRMLGEIDGAPMDVVPLGLVHMPPGVRHCTMASAEGDITVFVVKDTSHGLSGPPVDGIEDGPRYLPGFGPQGAGNQ